MKLSHFFSFLVVPAGLAVGLVGCETTNFEPFPSDQEEGWTPPEQQAGVKHVDINGQWRLESSALDVVRDEASKRQVVMASAQGNVMLTSLRAPQQTRVATKCTADAIYYDAYQNRFEMVGNPVVEQGLAVTSKSGSSAKIVMYGDGSIVKDPPPKTRETTTLQGATTL